MRNRVGVAVALACFGLAWPLAAQTITEFPIPTTGSAGTIATGPDGNLWWTEPYANRIGRITPAGIVTKFRIAQLAGIEAGGIAAGPDGNLWFTARKAHKIYRITTAGVITQFPLPPDKVPDRIAAGPDGNLWFTDGNRIGRITTAGVVTEFSTLGGQSLDIVAGPDGNLWFTDPRNDRIGRITTSGVVTEYQTPTAGGKPWGIAAGADGNLWFTELNGNKIGRITTAGVVTEFPIPTANSSSSSIAAGPDGNLWFTENSANTLGRITTTGVIAEFPIPTANLAPGGIAAGPDGSLWFAEWSAIGRITTSPCTSAAAMQCLETGEGSLDVSSNPAGRTRVLLRDADRISVPTLDATGLWTSAPFEGPFSGWYATAIADGSDGVSRVLWRNRDGRVSLEYLGPSGSLAAIRFAAEPGWTAIDVSVGVDGRTHLLQTSEDGRVRLTSVDSSGATTEGTTQGPWDGWSARALDDGPDGATWVLWRHDDGGAGIVRYREGMAEASFRWAGNPSWEAEDLAVRDGVPRVLWTNPDGRMGISSVDSQGQLFDRKVYASVGQQARRIADSPDGKTRVLWRGAYGTGSLWILNPDNSIESRGPTPGFEVGGPAAGTWTGTYEPTDWLECDAGPADAHLEQYGSIVVGTLSSSSGCGFTVSFQGTLEGRSLAGTISGPRRFDENGTAKGIIADIELDLAIGSSVGYSGGQVHLRRLAPATQRDEAK